MATGPNRTLTTWAVGLVLMAVTAGSAGYVMGFERRVDRLDSAQQTANTERAVLVNEVTHLTEAIHELKEAVKELNSKLEKRLK